MTAAALPAAARVKLAKLLGLLGSNHAGERDAAGLAAQRLLHQHGATWEQLLAPGSEHKEPQRGFWRETCAELTKRQNDLRAWERQFVADLPRYRRLSIKQRNALDEIAARVLGPGHA